MRCSLISGSHHTDLTIDGAAVERVSGEGSEERVMGVHLTDELYFSTNNTAVITKASQAPQKKKRGPTENMLTLRFTSASPSLIPRRDLQSALHRQGYLHHQRLPPPLTWPVLPLAVWYRSISCRNTRTLDGFFAQAVTLINGLDPPNPLSYPHGYTVRSASPPICMLTHTHTYLINLCISVNIMQNDNKLS